MLVNNKKPIIRNQLTIQSLENILLAVFPPVIGLLPSAFNPPFISRNGINVLVVLFHLNLLLIKLLNDLLVDSLHNFHFLQLLGETFIFVKGAVLDLSLQLVDEFFLENICFGFDYFLPLARNELQ
jgi:hypothetical protein